MGLRSHFILTAFGIGMAMLTSAAPRQGDLTTIAERTAFTQTGRYEEVMRLCPAYERAYARRVRCFTFGKTPEGRPMLALAISGDGRLTSAQNGAVKRPVLLFQGGIHAGEIDGKDAGFWFVRQLLDGKTGLAKDTLKNVTIVFIPVFNIDGHERFGRNNRPNQIGPEESGWRTTAWNLNLNRDYVKAAAPEMQALLALLNEWDPIVYADLHVTDGAKFQHDIAVLTRPYPLGRNALERAGVTLRDAVQTRLIAKGNLPLSFYPSFKDEDDPKSGIEDGVSLPRFGYEYWGLRNRFGILVETHSWKDYAHRVKATYETLSALTDLTAQNGVAWRAAAQAADEGASALAGKEVALTFDNTATVRTVTFKGYAYSRTMSEISGKLWTRYDDKQPQDWQIPLWEEVKPALVKRAPLGGYIVTPAHAARVAKQLRLHGIQFQILPHGLKDLVAGELDVFRMSSVELGKSSYEGRTTAKVKGAWAPELRPVPPGSLLVPIAQPNAVLAMHVLEPEAPDSLVSWGEFNAFFEAKEYMESYVAEEVARDMLGRDPELKVAFEERLRSDPVFEKDPAARLEFFYRRHPSWDERRNLYPIYRLNR